MAEIPVAELIVAPTVTPIPSPNVGAGGVWGWLASHLRPFRDSLSVFVGSPEFASVERAALATGSVCGFVATIVVAASPALQEAGGPFLAPFIMAATGWLATHFGVRAKMNDSTDSAGQHVPAGVVTESPQR